MIKIEEIIGALESELHKKPINRDFVSMKRNINELYNLFQDHPLTTDKFMFFIRILTETFYDCVNTNYTGRYDEIIRTGIKFVESLYNDVDKEIKQTFI